MSTQHIPARRAFLRNTLGLAAAGAGGGLLASHTVYAKETSEAFEIVKTDKEWLAQLGPDRYKILREEGTERPGTSALLKEKREGTYHCAGCDLPVYSSKTKYESGTGWPSFYDALPNAIGTREDRKLIFSVRTEVHCRRCGGHFGHVFDDGPKPTGKRPLLKRFSDHVQARSLVAVIVYGYAVAPVK